jgi:phosphoribosylglycinamide formyltransferase-1
MADEKKNIVFLCSGGGGNLKFVKTAIDRGWLGDVTLKAVLTDRECEANEYSRSNGIVQREIDFNEPQMESLVRVIDSYNPDIIITTVHKVLSLEVTNRFRNKLVNLHYSLLPSFGGSIGASPIKKAIDYGVSFTGVTVHLVDEKLDGGRPLAQAIIPLRYMDNQKEIMDIAFRCGCITLGSVIFSFFEMMKQIGDKAESVVSIKSRQCVFSSTTSYLPVIQREEFWAELRN